MFRKRRTPATPDIEGLRIFSEKGDRSPAPAFVGRESVLAGVEGTVRRVARGDAQGGIRLIYGAPGAGKSALLEELARRWRAREASDAPIPLFVSADDFAEPALVAEAILDTLNPGATPFPPHHVERPGRRKPASFRGAWRRRHPGTPRSPRSPAAGAIHGRCFESLRRRRIGPDR